MNFIVSGTTDIGLTKSTNQDSYNIRAFSTPWGRVVFAVLCDGMGGLSRGEVASASLVNAFTKWTENYLTTACQEGFSQEDIQRDWGEIVTVFNEKIKSYGKTIGAPVGTTVTAIWIDEERYVIINVGDTRAYEITDRVTVLTNDQTLVAREVAQGRMTPEEAAIDPRRNVLLQCVGASDTVYPDFFVGNTKKDAVYMLCSDGFRHEITSDEIFKYLNPEIMLDEAGMTKNLNDLIVLNKQRAERDNITVISIRTF